MHSISNSASDIIDFALLFHVRSDYAMDTAETRETAKRSSQFHAGIYAGSWQDQAGHCAFGCVQVSMEVNVLRF